MSIELRSYSLYLFDLDSTLTESISGKTFPQYLDDRKLMRGRKERLAELKRQGKKTCIITNQGGAAWGFVDPDEMHNYLAGFCIAYEIDNYFVCFHDTGEKARASDKTDKTLTVPDLTPDGYERRKPGPGMLFQAMQLHEINRQDTLMVGDREEDKGAAEAAGCDFMWAWDYFGDGPIIV
jgi:D-glycero-D-manno-heptose 1,7-bisphosphate phosphatase